MVSVLSTSFDSKLELLTAGIFFLRDRGEIFNAWKGEICILMLFRKLEV